jgi:N-acylneuraminate cytidylyltransferase
LYPTTPLLTSNTLIESYDKFKTGDFDSLVPVVKFSYPPQRGLRVSDEKLLSMIHPENSSVRSQDLETLYHDVGQFYWVKSSVFLSEKRLFTKRCRAFELDEIYVQDVDNLSDWELAEFKYQFLKSRKGF